MELSKDPWIVLKDKSLPINDKCTSSWNNSGYLSLKSGYFIVLPPYLIKQQSILHLLICVKHFTISLIFSENL
jgi:hypothetical protein